MTNNCIPGNATNQIQIYATFNEDPGCNIRFYNQKEGKPIILFSFPGSGNTWIRHLMDISMGIYTGSVYNDMSLYNRGVYTCAVVYQFRKALENEMWVTACDRSIQ